MKLNNDKVTKTIYRKLVINIVLFSSVVTLLSTFIQLYSDYLSDIERIESVQYDVLSSYIRPLELALWSLDTESIEYQTSGIAQITNISSIRIITAEDKIWEEGEYKNKLSATWIKLNLDVWVLWNLWCYITIIFLAISSTYCRASSTSSLAAC